MHNFSATDTILCSAFFLLPNVRTNHPRRYAYAKFVLMARQVYSRKIIKCRVTLRLWYAPCASASQQRAHITDVHKSTIARQDTEANRVSSRLIVAAPSCHIHIRRRTNSARNSYGSEISIVVLCHICIHSVCALLFICQHIRMPIWCACVCSSKATRIAN